MRVVFFIVFSFLSSLVYSQEQVRISIHPDRIYQQIYGFGASDAWRCQFVGKNWPIGKREAIADLLFSKDIDHNGDPKGIGLSLWRFYIGAGSTEQGDDSGIGNIWRRAECFQNPDGTYDWTKQAGQRWFLNAARRRGVEKLLAFTIAAPVHMSVNGKAFNSTNQYSMNIQPDKMDDYAKFLVDVVEHFDREENVRFDYLSPVNEPQWLWEKATQEGTPATNDDIFTLTKHLSRELSQRKLQTQVLLGEAGAIQYLYSDVDDHGNDRQVPTFFGEDEPFNITELPNVHPAITGHSYFTTWPVDKMVEHRLALRDTMLAVNPKVEYWQTEFCILQSNDDVGGGGKRDLGMNTALYFARVIHHDLVLANASSWQFWTALSNADFKDGLVYLDDGGNGVSGYNHPASKTLQKDGFFRESKTLWAFGNYSRFVRPGMKRIDVDYAEQNASLVDIAKDLMVSAFVDEAKKELVIVAVNYSTGDRKLVLDNSAIIKGNKLKTYTTSASKDLASGVSPADEIVIPARAVVTLVGSL